MINPTNHKEELDRIIKLLGENNLNPSLGVYKNILLFYGENKSKSELDLLPSFEQACKYVDYEISRSEDPVSIALRERYDFLYFESEKNIKLTNNLYVALDLRNIVFDRIVEYVKENLKEYPIYISSLVTYEPNEPINDNLQEMFESNDNEITIYFYAYLNKTIPYTASSENGTEVGNLINNLDFYNRKRWCPN